MREVLIAEKDFDFSIVHDFGKNCFIKTSSSIPTFFNNLKDLSQLFEEECKLMLDFFNRQARIWAFLQREQKNNQNLESLEKYSIKTRVLIKENRNVYYIYSVEAIPNIINYNIIFSADYYIKHDRNFIPKTDPSELKKQIRKDFLPSMIPIFYRYEGGNKSVDSSLGLKFQRCMKELFDFKPVWEKALFFLLKGFTHEDLINMKIFKTASTPRRYFNYTMREFRETVGINFRGREAFPVMDQIFNFEETLNVDLTGFSANR